MVTNLAVRDQPDHEDRFSCTQSINEQEKYNEQFVNHSQGGA
jgi:hypothetical protein